jgi:hypothetical protein
MYGGCAVGLGPSFEGDIIFEHERKGVGVRPDIFTWKKEKEEG